MASQGKYWLWLLLLLSLLLLMCCLGGCQGNRTAPQAEAPPTDSGAGTAQSAPPPTYVPINQTLLSGLESSAEYVVSGRVTTELMEALPGATVSLYETTPRYFPPAFEQPAPLALQTCDQDGRYEIRLKVPANLWASVRKDGYAAVNAFLPVRDPRTTVRNYILREAQASVTGFVLDKQSMPVAGALVVANPQPFTFVADSPIPAPIGQLTDSTGKYTIDKLPDGDVNLVASARGYAQQEGLSPLRAGQFQQLDFHLPPGQAVAFTVKNIRGEVLPYATAQAVGYVKITGGDKRGVIEFSVPLEVSPFDCTVTADGYQSNAIQLNPKDPPSVVVLEDRPVFRGRVVTDSGQAVAGAWVTVWGTGGAQGKFDGAVETDRAGRFVLSLSYPPVREVKLTKAGFFDQRLTFESGKPVPPESTVRLKSVEAGIYGRVIDFRGLAVKRFVVHMRSSSEASGGPEYQKSFSSDRGSFSVTDVAPGTYTLVVQSVQSATTDDVQLMQLDKVELRKGFLLGEVIVQFAKPKFAK